MADETAFLVRFLLDVYVDEKRTTNMCDERLWPHVLDGLKEWLYRPN